MSQPSVASFFNTRKRAAAEDVLSIKNRRLTETTETTSTQDLTSSATTTLPSTSIPQDDIAQLKAAASAGGVRTRSGRTVKRIGVQPSQETNRDILPSKMAKLEQQQKLQAAITKTPSTSSIKELSEARKKANEETPSTQTLVATSHSNAFAAKNSATNIDRGLKTPTKQIIKGSGTPLKQGELKSLVRKELNFDEVKSKVSRSAKLQELKASLSRIQELEKTRKAQEERNRRLREGVSPAKKAQPVMQLKEFDTIELEILSPVKTFKTPTKQPPPTPDKNELMSPRHTDVSKRVLFSPAKDGSPSKMLVPPAYQRFMHLAESTKPAGQLPLPYKYRHLVEIFRALDAVCAMFHNRKECITFKKLKPAVQRMLRKNFSEIHLAQIKHLYPEAFLFTQMKMRNYGSTSKADYFQLVVTPNVESVPEKPGTSQKVDEDNVIASAQSTAMNPHVMTERLQRFQRLLLQRVLDEHDKFLRSLVPPLVIPKERVTRWHPDFDLENCPDIDRGHLPQPPNVEKYSSARDILSTARNLFNCATPMERAIKRYEAKIEADRVVAENQKNATQTQREDENITANEDRPELVQKGTQSNIDTLNANSSMALNFVAQPTVTVSSTTKSTDLSTSTLLKGVPKSLLDKIRAKQAAKALDAMTRRPSQDQEAAKYSRLPELARHLRNVFITERKSVLTLEMVIKKIQNSFRTCLTPQEIEAHLQLLAKEASTWVAFHEVRKTMYLKIVKDMDLSKIIKKLEAVANEKSK